jgi:CrcB protein
MTYFLLMIGGVAGALARYHGARLVQARAGGDFPLGTFLINLSGSFALGMLVGLVATHPGWPARQLSLLLGTGFCGAYTTFSSFGWETIQLWRQGTPRQALFNLLGQPLLGGLAAAAGLLLGARLF